MQCFEVWMLWMLGSFWFFIYKHHCKLITKFISVGHLLVVLWVLISSLNCVKVVPCKLIDCKFVLLSLCGRKWLMEAESIIGFASIFQGLSRTVWPEDFAMSLHKCATFLAWYWNCTILLGICFQYLFGLCFWGISKHWIVVFYAGLCSWAIASSCWCSSWASRKGFENSIPWCNDKTPAT